MNEDVHADEGVPAATCYENAGAKEWFEEVSTLSIWPEKGLTWIWRFQLVPQKARPSSKCDHDHCLFQWMEKQDH